MLNDERILRCEIPMTGPGRGGASAEPNERLADQAAATTLRDHRLRAASASPPSADA